MDASTSPGESSSPCGSFGFSRNARIWYGFAGSTLMTPNWSASSMGWRIAATVAPCPDAMCASIIWLKSMR